MRFARAVTASDVNHRPARIAPISRRTLYVGKIQRGAQSWRESPNVIVRPEMHEEQMWRITDHVAVQRSDLDSVLTQCPHHRIDFTPKQDKVPGDGRLPLAC